MFSFLNDFMQCALFLDIDPIVLASFSIDSSLVAILKNHSQCSVYIDKYCA